MSELPKVLGSYKNGNYDVIILEDGTKIRQTEEEEFIPAFAENCDVKITDRCGIGCSFCSTDCIRKGRYATFDESLNNFLNSLHSYTELSINGNDLDCPGLENFLAVLKAKKVFVNITVHGKQLLNNIKTIKDWQERNLIYGIGVSVSPDTLYQNIKVVSDHNLKNVVFRTIVGITTPGMYEYIARHNQKVLILGYKETGRGSEYKEKNKEKIESIKQWLKDNIQRLWSQAAVVSFDNLALEQLDIKSLLTREEWERFYMGDDGSFTFYIDLVRRTFSRNFVIKDRFPMEDKTVDEMFQFIRKLL